MENLKRRALRTFAVLSICLSFFPFMPLTYACDLHGKTGIVEDNDLYIAEGDKSANGLDEATFNKVIADIEAIYAPIIKEKKKTLNVERKWSDGTVNAYASRSGNTWKVAMFGGLARHSVVTTDGFALVLCHEIGHHLGGAPKVSGFFGLNTWAANEGQADYFGSMKCLRRYFEKDNNEEIVAKMKVPATVTEKCKAQFTLDEDVAICQRGAMAGSSLANLFKELKKLDKAPQFDTPDTKTVAKIDNKHPAPQCRLDTYFAGSLCQKRVSEDMGDKDITKGSCTKKENYTIGLRPNCWFKEPK